MGLTPYQNQVVADGASNYWPLNEKAGLVATDIVGAKNGTISAAVSLGQTGPLPDGTTGMLFHGNPDQIGLPSLNPASLFSLEIWVKRTLPNPTDQCLMQIGNVGLYILGGGTNTLELIAGASIIGLSTTTIADALFHHVVATYDGVTMHNFIDSVDVSGATAVHGGGAAVGFIGNGVFGNFAKAILKDAAFYPSILTAAQVKNHFNTFRLSGRADGLIGTPGQLISGPTPILGGGGNFS